MAFADVKLKIGLFLFLKYVESEQEKIGSQINCENQPFWPVRDFVRFKFRSSTCPWHLDTKVWWYSIHQHSTDFDHGRIWMGQPLGWAKKIKSLNLPMRIGYVVRFYERVPKRYDSCPYVISRWLLMAPIFLLYKLYSKKSHVTKTPIFWEKYWNWIVFTCIVVLP